MYSPEYTSIKRFYYISDKVSKTIEGTVITSQSDMITISSFNATKEDVDIKTDLCTLNTYESSKKIMIKILFVWATESILDVRI